jgi:hypothetical protein
MYTYLHMVSPGPGIQTCTRVIFSYIFEFANARMDSEIRTHACLVRPLEHSRRRYEGLATELVADWEQIEVFLYVF